jgi:hypothetical protein
LSQRSSKAEGEYEGTKDHRNCAIGPRVTMQERKQTSPRPVGSRPNREQNSVTDAVKSRKGNARSRYEIDALRQAGREIVASQRSFETTSPAGTRDTELETGIEVKN